MRTDFQVRGDEYLRFHFLFPKEEAKPAGTGDGVGV